MTYCIVWIDAAGETHYQRTTDGQLASLAYNELVQQIRDGRVTHVELTMPAIPFPGWRAA